MRNIPRLLVGKPKGNTTFQTSIKKGKYNIKMNVEVIRCERVSVCTEFIGFWIQTSVCLL